MAIIETLLHLLHEKLQEMQQCLDDGDFNSLGEHAHWLKGSGGTVGFTQFIEPAKELEQATKLTDTNQSQQILATIRDIHSRIRFDDETDNSEAVGTQNVSQLPELSLNQSNEQSLVESSPERVDNKDKTSAEPVFSSLPMSNPRFRGIVERFLPRLEEQITAFQSAIDASDFSEIAKLAHWLKGSGGNVGFEGLTQLAATLELSAKDNDIKKVAEDFEAVLHYSVRVNQGWEMLEPLEKSA